MQNDSSTRHVSSLSLSRRNILQKVFDFKKNPNFNFGIYVIDKFQLIEKKQLLVFSRDSSFEGKGFKAQRNRFPSVGSSSIGHLDFNLTADRERNTGLFRLTLLPLPSPSPYHFLRSLRIPLEEQF